MRSANGTQPVRRARSGATRDGECLTAKVSLDLPLIRIPEFQGLLGSALKGLSIFRITD